jgi:hypothetical protein
MEAKIKKRIRKMHRMAMLCHQNGINMFGTQSEALLTYDNNC